MFLVLKSLTLSFLLDSAISYKLHNALNSIIFTTNELPSGKCLSVGLGLVVTTTVLGTHNLNVASVLINLIHSEYYFGKCASAEKVLLIKHIFQYEDLIDALVVRAPLEITKEPSCIFIRAKSGWSELVRYHAFKFNICICRLIYNYGGQVFVHFFYEWYTPVEMMKELTWELYFYE